MTFTSFCKSSKPLLITASWLLLVSCLAANVEASNEYPLRDAVECLPRGGVPNFRAKVEAGQAVKIGYLGGSITAAPGWRVQSRNWLEQKYPKAEFEEINAAIGGTGSDLGVFRLQNDVLRHHPDLLFVEFAVNDGGASPERIHKAMEGIVRQTRRSSPDIDICFVYTISAPMLADVQSGKMPRSASAMEEVADHYQIPSIHFGVRVAAMESSGELVFKAPKPSNLSETRPMVFSSEGVHPHAETGHRLYTDAIARSWPAIWNAGSGPLAHDLPTPMRADNWELASQVAITADMLHGTWNELDETNSLKKRFQRNMPHLFQAKEPGASLVFTFDGITAAIFDLVGPDGGQLSVQLDDRASVSVNRIDGYCTYHRMSKFSVASDLPAGRHTVRITLSPDTLNKREILFARNRADFDKSPDKYAPHTWYVGSLLVIGEVIPDGAAAE